METFEAIVTRRSVKHYDAEAVMPEADFQKLMSAVILTPSAYNIQNWRFVRVQDQKLREQLKEAAWGQSQVADASELIIICADTDAWQDRPERYWANADADTQAILLPMIDNYYRGKEQVQHDDAMRACGMAAQTLMLSARAMGYDTCPMSGFDFDKVAELIKLPESHVISMMIVIGKAKTAAHPRGGQLPLEDVLVSDGF